MSKRLAVTLEAFPYHDANIAYVSYCKGCHTYNISRSQVCYKCNEKLKQVSLEQIAEETVKKNFKNRCLILLLIYTLLFLVSMNFKSLMISTGSIVICLCGHVLIYNYYKKHFVMDELKRHLNHNRQHIKNDFEQLFEVCKKQVSEGNYLEAYENLRYLGKVVDHEELRTLKLMCLSHFRLRSDMEFEVKEVLVEKCNVYLIDYIYEVAKLKRQVIDEASIAYILRYEKDILALQSGREVIATVVGCALKSKLLLNRFAEVVYEYVDYLPKERVLRLCKIQQGIKDKELREKILERIELKYGREEALERYL